MYWKEIVEFSFYFVETFALPFAILVFIFERRKERLAEEEELNQHYDRADEGRLRTTIAGIRPGWPRTGIRRGVGLEQGGAGPA